MWADKQADRFGKAIMRSFATLRCEHTKRNAYRAKNRAYYSQLQKEPHSSKLSINSA
jgi:hypothetical protein